MSEPLRDLIGNILVPADKRLTLEEILHHPWIEAGNEITTVEPVLNYTKMKKFLSFSKLKAVVLTFIASQLPIRDIESLSILFKFIDTNNDGYLTVDEYEKILHKQGLTPTHQELHAVLKSIDMDKNGKISFN